MNIPIYIFQDFFTNINNTNPILHFDKIKFSDTPYKKFVENNTIYFIDMYYKNNSIIIQLPRYTIKTLSDNKITLIIDNNFINYLIKPLEQHIIHNVHKYSEKLFNGKQFSLNKITTSFISPNKEFQIDISTHKDTLFFNRYRNIIDYNNIIQNNDEKQIMCLIKISNLQFLNNRFTYQIQLEQGKIFMNEKLTEYSFIDQEKDITTMSDDNEYYHESINSDKNFF